MRPPTSLTHLHILAVLRAELAVGRRREGPLSVLDAGCGKGELVAYLLEGLRELEPGFDVELFGFDVDDSLTEHASSLREMAESLERLVPGEPWPERLSVVSVADPWPYPDGRFDVVTSNQVLEHVEDLPAFLGELHRTLRPGGFSVHVFPLRRVLIEWHLKMPIVHLIRDNRARARAIERFSRLGVGTYREVEADGVTPEEFGRARSDFIQFGTFYRSWGELSTAAQHAGLRVTQRYTRGLYAQKGRALVGRPPAFRYRPEPSPLLDWLSFLVLPELATATIVLEKPPYPDTWRRPPGSA